MKRISLFTHDLYSVDRVLLDGGEYIEVTEIETKEFRRLTAIPGQHLVEKINETLFDYFHDANCGKHFVAHEVLAPLFK